jgi:hypothetical protein
MHDWVAVASAALAAIFRNMEEARVRFRFRDAPVRAITVKHGARGATMMAALRIKACGP